MQIMTTNQPNESRITKVSKAITSEMSALYALYSAIIAILKKEYSLAIASTQASKADVKALVSGLIEACGELKAVQAKFAGTERNVVSRAALFFLIGCFNPRNAKTNENTERKLVLPVQAMFKALQIGFVNVTSDAVYSIVKSVRLFIETEMSDTARKAKLSDILDSIAKLLGAPMMDTIKCGDYTFSARSLFYQYLLSDKLGKKFCDALHILCLEYQKIGRKSIDAMLARIESDVKIGITDILENRMKAKQSVARLRKHKPNAKLVQERAETARKAKDVMKTEDTLAAKRVTKRSKKVSAHEKKANQDKRAQALSNK